MLGFGLQLNKQRQFEGGSPTDPVQLFINRVQDDGGTVEALSCLVDLYQFLNQE